MKKSKGAVILVLILAFTVAMLYLAKDVVEETSISQSETDNSVESTGIKLGLDLSGGVSITYRIVDENPSDKDVSDTMAKLEKRAESYTTEYSVYKVGTDRITVEIPGVYDANAVLEELGSPGSLYFIKHYDDDGNANYSYGTNGYELNYTIDELIENGSVIITGDGVKSAEAGSQKDSTTQATEYVVQLVLNDDAAELWADATTEAYNNSNDTIGIYYDGSFISVPSVNEPITDGNCIISGMDDYEEADQLATYIRVGAIPLELEELESQVVGAQLGGEALSTSMKAGVIGLVLIVIFMIAFYGISGVAASLALVLYSALVILFINWFEVTLTLPGIAGIILGIGMAVDANVIIFARLREEIAAGKSVIVAIKEGYKKALSAILDGQITTFIAAIVLMILGSGTVKGFAYTLMFSIVLSLFTALVVAQWLMRSFYALGIRDAKFYGKAKERKPFRFVENRVKWFAISIAVIVIGFGTMIYNGAAGNGALNFSLEFKGGTSTTIDMPESYTIDQIESDVVPVVQSAIGENEPVQATTVSGTNKIELKTRTLTLEEREAMDQAIEDTFGVDQSAIETQVISSTISSEMRSSAIGAVVVACIFMLLYIWFRFKDIRFATSAIIALVHDVLVVLTSYALIRISVGNTFIACMLTIVGYSVNDTIVIFDRIRENLHGAKKKTPEELAEIADRSLTQTLSRSINTSITTFIMVFLLYIMGVSSIKEFALPLIVGIVCGSYSSIFIATELWYIMKLHLGKNKMIK